MSGLLIFESFHLENKENLVEEVSRKSDSYTKSKATVKIGLIHEHITKALVQYLRKYPCLPTCQQLNEKSYMTLMSVKLNVKLEPAVSACVACLRSFYWHKQVYPPSWYLHICIYLACVCCVCLHYTVCVAHLLCDGKANDGVSLGDVPCHHSGVCFQRFDGHIDRR